NIIETHPSVKLLVRQVNMGTFIEDSRACFPKSDRNPSMVVAHPLNRLADFELLLCAARHLAIDGYEFVLAIIGSGKAEKTIRKTIKKLGLGQIVNITNEFHPLRAVFCGADIFIQPQPTRLFPASLLEAMSAGTAVAACDSNESDLIIENQTALLFDPDDELSIYATLKKLLDEHETARRLAANAQDLIRNNHTVSRMVNNMLEIYHKAAVVAGTSALPAPTD
ncbi:MAG: glycosyltransferase, partial [Planctomycetes bacterium]|nr:glycosyltransferase [Planctomycetota bacterium]